MPPPYPRAKVMGERHSGTNFVHALLALNFEAELLPNAMPFTVRHVELLERVPLTNHGREAVHHRAVDLNHDWEFDRHAGWKHACLTDRHFTDYPDADRTLFVCVIRHPALWLRSMFHAPFGTFLSDNRARDIGEFLVTPWITRPRDEIGELVLESPAHLWAHKVDSFLREQEARSNVLVLRHEDILRHHAPCLDLVANFLTPSRPEWEIPKGNSRSHMPHQPDQDRDFWRIRDELPEDPYSVLEPRVSEALQRIIGGELLARTGYLPGGITSPVPKERNFGPPLTAEVTFSSEASEHLRKLDNSTKPGMVLAMLWSLGGKSWDRDGNLLEVRGPHLGCGWYFIDDVPEDRIVQYPGFRIMFGFPETEAEVLRIAMGETGDGNHGLVFDGNNPFAS